MAVSAGWLRRFRYGPVEWVLRWLTNARRPAFVVPAVEDRPATVPQP